MSPFSFACVTGDAAGAGGDHLVGHVDVAACVHVSFTHADSHSAGVLTQRPTSAVRVARQNVVVVCSTKDLG